MEVIRGGFLLLWRGAIPLCSEDLCNSLLNIALHSTCLHSSVCVMFSYSGSTFHVHNILIHSWLLRDDFVTVVDWFLTLCPLSSTFSAV